MRWFKKKDCEFQFYLAGAMSGIPEHNFPLFDKIAKQMRKQRYTVWSPAENNPITRTFSECIKVDLNAIINKCQAIALLPGWRSSTGANVEVFVGNACGKIIYEILGCDSELISFNKLDANKYVLPYKDFEK